MVNWNGQAVKTRAMQNVSCALFRQGDFIVFAGQLCKVESAAQVPCFDSVGHPSKTKVVVLLETRNGQRIHTENLGQRDIMRKA